MPDAPMPTGTLRAQLRAATTQAHARLDTLMARGIGSAPDYRAYLRGMHAFVASLVPGVAAQASAWGWALPDWQAQLARDLDDMHDRAPQLDAEVAAPLHDGEALGALYVLEGSALGARLLLRDATALGYRAGHGASFLEAHARADGGQRWPRFLAMLDTPEHSPHHAAACTAAQRTFQLAERCFRRALGTPA